MSIDFQLAHRCPHLIMEEPVDIGGDRRSLVTRAGIASNTILRVLANNAYYVPPAGLHSQALLVGAESGPFQIFGCHGDANAASTDPNWLQVTGSTESATFTLPPGNRITADRLVRLFRAELDDVVVTNENGYLNFVDVGSIGTESRVTLSGRGADAIGFSEQRSARGREVYPPWVLAERQDVLPRVNRNGQVIDVAKYVRFTRSVRPNATWKVTYATYPDRCLRCGGTFVENDWRFDIQGDLVTVQNENLLYQAALKILLTRRGSNPYHTAYGSDIMTRIGGKAVGATAQLIREDVRSALARMQSLQRQQAEYQQVTLKERLFSILSVEVLPHNTDPTAFLVDVVVSNGSSDPIRLTIVFSVPGAIALAGTNNLTLGLDTTGLTTAQSRVVFGG